MRNLWRAREDAVSMRLKARQQLKALLLRQARRCLGKTSWTKSHHRWIAEQRFEHEADRIALAEYQLAVETAELRVQRLTLALTRGAGLALRAGCCRVACPPRHRHRQRHRLGQRDRRYPPFGSARQFMAYLGLVPSEHSIGNSIRRGSITKTGNGHAPRLLAEAAWNYRSPARLSNHLRQRSRRTAGAGAQPRLEGPTAPEHTVCNAVVSRRAAQQDLRRRGTRVGRLRMGHRSAGRASILCSLSQGRKRAARGDAVHYQR
jgi:hypothetical protein